MTSITWAGPSCVQELGTFLAPQNRTQGRCVLDIVFIVNIYDYDCKYLHIRYLVLHDR